MDSEEQPGNLKMEEKFRELSSDEVSALTENSGPRDEGMAMKDKELQSVSSKSMGDEVPLLPNAQNCEQPSPSERKAESFTLEGGSPNASEQSLEEMEMKYAAYVRHDKYGTLGKGEVSWKEKALLLVALIVVVPIRVVVGFLILLTYYLICRLCTLFKAPNREDGQEDYAHMSGIRRSIIIACGRFLSRAMLFALGFYWIKEKYVIPSQSPNGLFVKDGSLNDAEESSYRPGAIVSNHVSYLDILYHMSASFPSFVAKVSDNFGPSLRCLLCLSVLADVVIHLLDIVYQLFFKI